MPGAAGAEAGAMPAPRDGKARLRAEMRARRAGLSPVAVAEAGAAAARRLESMPAVAGARRVAAYRAVRGEVPLDELLDGPRRDALTLPRVVGDGLEFVAWCDGQRVAPGAFGIPEPVDGEVVAFADHDAVLVPLVAFDARCHRLGQGGGFYDRALAALPSGPAAARPATIGVAHWFQQVDEIPLEPWDMPLDAVVTDRGVVISPSGLLA